MVRSSSMMRTSIFVTVYLMALATTVCCCTTTPTENVLLCQRQDGDEDEEKVTVDVVWDEETMKALTSGKPVAKVEELVKYARKAVYGCYHGDVTFDPDNVIPEWVLKLWPAGEGLNIPSSSTPAGTELGSEVLDFLSVEKDPEQLEHSSHLSESETKPYACMRFYFFSADDEECFVELFTLREALFVAKFEEKTVIFSSCALLRLILSELYGVFLADPEFYTDDKRRGNGRTLLKVLAIMREDYRY